MTLCTEMCY